MRLARGLHEVGTRLARGSMRLAQGGARFARGLHKVCKWFA